MMLARNNNSRQSIVAASKWISSTTRRAMSSNTATFDIPEAATHHIDSPPTTAEATKEELMHYHNMMYKLRRIEIMSDQEYKAKRIRGFCHLYDGQEAVAMGVQAALPDDDWITTYRCHGAALMRGITAKEIFAEMLGRKAGCSQGKGGSMHMYSSQTNFWGGAAIVGAQVPIGGGAAFYHQYMKNLKKSDEPTKVSLAMYGDGSANQGQVWECANMMGLYNCPFIGVIENNQYGMGTSTQRSSYLTEYYKQGNKIPGIQVDGQDVLAVREVFKFAKEYASAGRPIFVEAVTYRYHGHSMSDPGITYRTRDEVTKVRQTRDPIDIVKKRIIESDFATEDELKAIEKDIRTEVQQALKEAQESPEPAPEELYSDIYAKMQAHSSGWKNRLESEVPMEIRMPDNAKTLRF